MHVNKRPKEKQTLTQFEISKEKYNIQRPFQYPLPHCRTDQSQIRFSLAQSSAGTACDGELPWPRVVPGILPVHAVFTSLTKSSVLFS